MILYSNRSHTFVELLTACFGITVALLLFSFGLTFPLQARVNGDALEYLRIADTLSSWDVIADYAGTRTIGFPLFERGVYQVIALFTEPVFLLPWINLVGVIILTVHIVSTWMFSFWALWIGAILARSTRRIMFLVLASFPVLVGHTTAPVTDTFTVDLVLIGILVFYSSGHAKSVSVASLFAFCSGLIFGFATLVRPASLFSLSFAFLVCGFVSLRGSVSGRVASVCAFVGFVVVLVPSATSCFEKFGSVCIQSPKTANLPFSMQEGLQGARVLWTQATNVDSIPLLADEAMSENFYKKCKVGSLFGIDRTSFTGCLLSEPQWVPVLILKKWIGLFDYFRFTPYLENGTPDWLRLLSRVYGAVAWAGFCFSLLFAVRLLASPRKLPIQDWSQNLSMVLLTVYSAVMLGQHTVLHTEERYGFPLIPLSVVVFFKVVEDCRYGRDGIQSAWPRIFVIFGFVTIGVFALQVSAWDEASLLIRAAH